MKDSRRRAARLLTACMIVVGVVAPGTSWAQDDPRPYKFSFRAPTNLSGVYGLELKLSLSEGNCRIQTYMIGDDAGAFFPVRYHQYYEVSEGGGGWGWLALMNRNYVSARAVNPTPLGGGDASVESGSSDGMWFGGAGSGVQGPGTFTFQAGWFGGGFSPYAYAEGTPSQIDFEAPIMLDLECPGPIRFVSASMGREGKGFTQETMKGGAAVNSLLPGAGAGVLRTFEADLRSQETITMLSSYVTGFGAQVGGVGVKPTVEVTDVDVSGVCGDTHFTWTTATPSGSSVNFYHHEGEAGSCRIEVSRAAGWFVDLLAGVVLGLDPVSSLDGTGGTWQLIEPDPMG